MGWRILGALATAAVVSACGAQIRPAEPPSASESPQATVARGDQWVCDVARSTLGKPQLLRLTALMSPVVAYGDHLRFEVTGLGHQQEGILFVGRPNSEGFLTLARFTSDQTGSALVEFDLPDLSPWLDADGYPRPRVVVAVSPIPPSSSAGVVLEIRRHP